ncbi:MAG: hypothetical protein HY286_03170 [Planctomycetes bacterium]|nr:hypothetical protein [Planctomycetota bacterium]
MIRQLLPVICLLFNIAGAAPQSVSAPATRWVRGSRLRVVDKSTREDLSHLQMVTFDDPTHRGDGHPGLLDGFVKFDGGEDSPVRSLPMRGEVPRLWIRAPGYAWTRTTPFDGKPAHLIYPLEPECKWNVTLRNAPPEHAYLRLYYAYKNAAPKPARAGEDPNWYLNIPCNGRRSYMLDGLRPGNAILQIERETKDDLPLVLARAEAALLPGKPAGGPLTVTDPPAPAAELPLHITVVDNSPATGSSAFNLRIHNIRRGHPGDRNIDITIGDGEMVRDGGTPCKYRCTTSPLPPGEYMISDVNVNIHERLRIEPGERREWTLQLRERGRTDLLVLDASTQQPISDIVVSEIMQPKMDAGAGELLRTLNGSRYGRHVLEGAQGNHELFFESRALAISRRMTVAIESSNTTSTILLRRLGKCNLTFTDAGRISSDAAKRANFWIEGPSGVNDSNIHEAAVGFDILPWESGKCIIHFEEIPGYKTPDDLECYIAKDDIEVGVPIEREK